MPTVYTIGHSNHAVDRFIGLLKQHAIEAVADVRSAPYSRANPQYKKQALQSLLREAGVDYVFLGKELGARSDDPACYVGDKVQYRLLAETALFQSGLERVIDGAARYRVALMCAEREPLQCHRTILVARELEKHGVDIEHILADGSIETHAAALDRLARELAIAGDDLFEDRDIRARAVAIRADRIAYQRHPRNNGGR